MSWEPISIEELHELGRRIDSEFVYAGSIEELHGKLNSSYPHEEWAMLRSPCWCGDVLVALIVKPRVE